MNERKNLDRLFQEKFKDFESEPNEKVWQNIEAALKEEKEDRKIIPFWFRLSGIAAALLIGLFAFNAIFNSDPTIPKNSIVNGQNTTKSMQGSSKDAVVDNGSGSGNTTNPNNNTKNKETENNSAIANPTNVAAPGTEADKTKNTKNLNNPNNLENAVADGSKSGSPKTSTHKSKHTHELNNTENAVAGGTKSDLNKANASRNANTINNTGDAVANESKSGLNKAGTPRKKNALNNTKDAVANTKSDLSKAGTSGTINTLNNTKDAVADNSDLAGTSKNTKNTVTKKRNKNKTATPVLNTVNENAVATVTTKKGQKTTKVQPATVPNNDTKIAVITEKTKKGKKDAINPVSNNKPTANTTGVAAQENNTTIDNINPTSVLTPTIATPDNAVAVNKKEEPKTDDKKLDSTAIATVEPNALEELLLQNEKEKLLVAETKLNRWQITSSVAPIYFSSTANGGSPIDARFAGNEKTYENNMSFGVGVNYAVNKKISIRTGVNKFTLGYNTNDVAFFAGLQSQGLKNVTAPGNNSHIEVVNRGVAAAGLLPFEDGIQNSNDGYISQKMGYVEVPMEMSYKLVDKKFGITVIGGLSTLFLSENKVNVISSSMSASLGEASNLNDIHFSSNIGLGFKYSFWKSFEVNFEPMFKYQLNTFTNDVGNFKPYFIGLYSGLSFQF